MNKYNIEEITRSIYFKEFVVSGFLVGKQVVI